MIYIALAVVVVLAAIVACRILATATFLGLSTGKMEGDTLTTEAMARTVATALP